MPSLLPFFWVMPMISGAENAFDFFVQMHLTERCNLACTHCYQEGRPGKEMTLEEIERGLGDIYDTVRSWSETYEIPFAPSFNVTGGEPFLRKDLADILRGISRYGFACYLLTNGTLVDRERARMLADLAVRGVQVSVEGPEGIHESIRGKGSFSSAMRGIDHLLAAGVTVTMNVTLSELNGDLFPDIVTLAAGAGLQRLGFSRLVPYGRGSALTGKMLGRERLRDLYEGILSLAVPGLEIATGDPLATQLGDGGPEMDPDAPALGGCAAGISGITVLPDGTLTPCRRMGIPIGNILKEGLREVWANSEVLAALRDRKSYSGRCRNCARWPGCRGCRAIAYAYSLSRGGCDFLGEDPQCFLEAVSGSRSQAEGRETETSHICEK
ncbi:MAG: Antilisterial bacteriocin subtilosin biosynthesis protein AlbA [Syntrophorhabdus sp. PtaB.Bin047]|nr:MAG: Antilisterial bacteriocin subtilosin biosynthesis protein AlbA [Syntrophorhabdus sp. PtaB.Bin047]